MIRKSNEGRGKVFSERRLTLSAGWTAATPAPAVEWLSAVNEFLQFSTMIDNTDEFFFLKTLFNVLKWL